MAITSGKTIVLSENDYRRIIGIQQVVDKVRDIEKAFSDIEAILCRISIDSCDASTGGWYKKLNDYRHGDEVDRAFELLRKLRTDMYDVSVKNRIVNKRK